MQKNFKKKLRRRSRNRHTLVRLPETGLVRLPTILALIPIGKSTWWKGIQTGRYPPGVKLSPRVTVWRSQDIRRLIESA